MNDKPLSKEQLNDILNQRFKKVVDNPVIKVGEINSPIEIGDRVICIKNNEDNRDFIKHYKFPIMGKHYTVRDFDKHGPIKGLLLEELKNPLVETSDNGLIEVAFHPDYFIKFKK